MPDVGIINAIKIMQKKKAQNLSETVNNNNDGSNPISNLLNAK